jgi:hypothetical protein
MKLMEYPLSDVSVHGLKKSSQTFRSIAAPNEHGQTAAVENLLSGRAFDSLARPNGEDSDATTEIAG